VWRLWLPEGRQGRSDIYIAPRATARAMKASLHESGACRAGFTREYEIEQGWDQLPESGHRQILWWDRSIDPTSCSIPLTIRIPHAAVRQQVDWGQRDARTSWVPEPGVGRWVDFDIVIKGTEADWPARVRARPMVDEMTLPNGELVRISYSYKMLSRRERRDLRDSISVLGQEAAASTLFLPPEKGRVVWIDLPASRSR
jgi:hypothetical protein